MTRAEAIDMLEDSLRLTRQARNLAQAVLLTYDRLPDSADYYLRIKGDVETALELLKKED